MSEFLNLCTTLHETEFVEVGNARLLEILTQQPGRVYFCFLEFEFLLGSLDFSVGKSPMPDGQY